MRRIITGLLVTAFLGSASALADSTNGYGVTPGPNDSFNTAPANNNNGITGLNHNNQQPGTASDAWNSGTSTPQNDNSINVQPAPQQQPGTVINNNAPGNGDTMSSTSNAGDLKAGYLSNNIVSFQPQAGAMLFKDTVGDTTTRGVVGLTMDMNAVATISHEAGHLFVGPATGVLYSHVGSQSANFFGTNASNGAGLSDGANLLLIPADLKVGYAIGDNLRLSARGGGNVIYRSIANSINLGTSSTELGTNSGWRIFPNAGGDVEIGFGRNVSLMLRPDVTFTPGENIYTGTIGLGINLG